MIHGEAETNCSQRESWGRGGTFFRHINSPVHGNKGSAPDPLGIRPSLYPPDYRVVNVASQSPKMVDLARFPQIDSLIYIQMRTFARYRAIMKPMETGT